MITDIHIQNYKLFKSLQLKNLSQFTLIGGKNSSGKTSLLEALFLALDCAHPAMFLKSLQFRGLNSFPLNSIFEIAFHNTNINQPIKLEYRINNLEKKLEYRALPNSQKPLSITQQKLDKGGFTSDTEKNIIDFDKSMSNKDTFLKMEIRYGTGKNFQKAILESTVKGGLSLEPSRGLETYNEGVRAAFLPVVQPNLALQNANLYGELDKKNKTNDIVKALQILDPDLKSLSIIPEAPHPTLYVDMGFGKKIPLALMGQGIHRLLSILLLICNMKNGIIFVDEIENGFHHSIMSKIWKTITTHAKIYQTQVLAVTHSYEFVQKAMQSIDSDLKNSFAYIRIDREGEKFTPVYYSFENLNTASGENFEIR